MAKLKVIYTPSGRAGEYANHGFAVNLYKGCTHGCKYCFNTCFPWSDREKFHSQAIPRADVLKSLESDLEQIGQVDEPLFLCFSCDPYQPEEEEYRITRRAITLIHSSSNRVRILTKNGSLALRDIDFLGEGDEFGVTLTFASSEDSLMWEPGASSPDERINALYEAKKRGVRTWVSFEPVVYPEDVFDLIDKTASFVDIYKVGILNYVDKLPVEFQSRVPVVDWKSFADRVSRKLYNVGAEFYLKEDLLKAMGGSN
jgi:DNA repair photolyase